MIEAVEKLCDQHKYFKDLLQGNFKIKKANKIVDLNIKCRDEKKCTYSTSILDLGYACNLELYL